jgi:hypothetical protein
VSDDRVRIEIGYEGGQVSTLTVHTGSADELERALHEDGPRVVTLQTEDGPVHVVVPRVSYLKRGGPGGRVGFGTS